MIGREDGLDRKGGRCMMMEREEVCDGKGGGA